MVYTEDYAIGGSWLYESPGVEDLVGYTPEESGQPGFWKTILHPDDRERVLAEDRRVELTGDPWRMEYRSITKDGRVVWLRDHAVLVHGGPGEPSYWHGFVIDITEQKRAEQAIREALEREQQATRQLRALDEAKNVFLSAVSHELRTPLGVDCRHRSHAAASQVEPVRGRWRRPDRPAGGERRQAGRVAQRPARLGPAQPGIVTPKLRPTDLAAWSPASAPNGRTPAGRWSWSWSPWSPGWTRPWSSESWRTCWPTRPGTPRRTRWSGSGSPARTRAC